MGSYTSEVQRTGHISSKRSPKSRELHQRNTFPPGSWQFGHMGIGGQAIRCDPSNELVLCYLTNAMKAGSGEHTFTFNRLQKKVYDIIKP
ncbi:Beta-lactamase domain-containing protein [Trichostrongylus colubriformis]|uniref:Beta-lactamase domain-containing protein n=1 Tax=Trichostrongylus colubriformis TaxID=6319 RepID=A0AAN8IWU6_TRICO